LQDGPDQSNAAANLDGALAADAVGEKCDEEETQ